MAQVIVKCPQFAVTASGLRCDFFGDLREAVFFFQLFVFVLFVASASERSIDVAPREVHIDAEDAIDTYHIDDSHRGEIKLARQKSRDDLLFESTWRKGWWDVRKLKGDHTVLLVVAKANTSLLLFDVEFFGDGVCAFDAFGETNPDTLHVGETCAVDCAAAVLKGVLGFFDRVALEDAPLWIALT